jgi:hypothetical protein
MPLVPREIRRFVRLMARFSSSKVGSSPVYLPSISTRSPPQALVAIVKQLLISELLLLLLLLLDLSSYASEIVRESESPRVSQQRTSWFRKIVL